MFVLVFPDFSACFLCPVFVAGAAEAGDGSAEKRAVVPESSVG
jgi:hypothetical protein